MNLFLRKGRSQTRNSPPINLLKNKYKINSYLKSGINHRNKISLFNPKGKSSKLLLRMPNDTVKSYNIMKTEYSKENNPISLKEAIIKNKINNSITKTIETNKSSNNINLNSIINSEENIIKNKNNKSLLNLENKTINQTNSDIKNKTVINLKKKNSLFAKEPQHLNKMFDLSMLHRTPRNNTFIKNSQSGTFFTSIPIENNSKRNSQTSKISNSKQYILRKQYYDAIKLKELQNQVYKFETSENFLPNEKIIEKYLTSSERFINRKYTKKLNLKKRIKLSSCEKQKIILKKMDYSIPNTKSKKAKNLYVQINNLEKESDINLFDVKNSKKDSNHEKTDKILKNALKKLKNDEVTEYLKEIALEYKKEIGDFIFYNGKGIYTNHLAAIKKNENLLAFMLSNELLD